MPIPRGLIRRITANDEIYTQALSIFAGGGVKNVHVDETDFVDEYKINAAVKDDSREYEVTIEIDED